MTLTVRREYYEFKVLSNTLGIAYIVKITLNIVLNPIFLPIYLGIAPTSYKMDFKVEPDINSVEVNPQLSDK
jgi:hypothetical protein